MWSSLYFCMHLFHLLHTFDAAATWPRTEMNRFKWICHQPSILMRLYRDYWWFFLWATIMIIRSRSAISTAIGGEQQKCLPILSWVQRVSFVDWFESEMLLPSTWSKQLWSETAPKCHATLKALMELLQIVRPLFVQWHATYACFVDITFCCHKFCWHGRHVLSSTDLSNCRESLICISFRRCFFIGITLYALCTLRDKCETDDRHKKTTMPLNMCLRERERMIERDRETENGKQKNDWENVARKEMHARHKR